MVLRCINMSDKEVISAGLMMGGLQLRVILGVVPISIPVSERPSILLKMQVLAST